jgi:phage tail sheath protein FI
MPVTPTYPGVYIQELSSGVHTITGVATSITAFLGRASRGPLNQATTVTSQADFQRNFGSLNRKFPMTYAVNDFFQNGGSQAVIVRLFKAAAGAKTVAKLSAGKTGGTLLPLQAASFGTWGNGLKVRITASSDMSSQVAQNLGLTTADLFNLAVQDSNTGVVETYLNLTVKDSPNKVDLVLKNNSNLLAFQDSATMPSGVPTAHKVAPKDGSTIWTDTECFSGVASGDAAVDGDALDAPAYKGDPAAKSGQYALENADLFNLLCIPEDAIGQGLPKGVYSNALPYCVTRRAVLLVDSPADWKVPGTIAQSQLTGFISDESLNGDFARNAALYFPRIREFDPNMNGQPDTFVPCGMIAGIMARTDTQRGVWKAPAGIDASLSGSSGLSIPLTDNENGLLNPLGINCLRNFPIYGSVVWGARTMAGADVAADEYKYVPVRRTALYIEESLYRGTKWVVFEPNDEPLWAQIRLNVGAFMHDLFRKGAFQGSTPQQAYFVKCDKETTTQNDINQGIVNIVVGFAPLKPAEFVIITLQQIAGQIDT